MGNITIEGSLSPAAGLARGERRTVQDTPDVRAYVARGFAVIVDERTETEVEADVNAEQARQEIADADGPVVDENPPRRNASRDDWAEFLALHPDGYVTAGKDRDQLIAEWDANHPAE